MIQRARKTADQKERRRRLRRASPTDHLEIYSNADDEQNVARAEQKNLGKRQDVHRGHLLTLSRPGPIRLHRTGRPAGRTQHYAIRTPPDRSPCPKTAVASSRSAQARARKKATLTASWTLSRAEHPAGTIRHLPWGEQLTADLDDILASILGTPDTP